MMTRGSLLIATWLASLGCSETSTQPPNAQDIRPPREAKRDIPEPHCGEPAHGIEKPSTRCSPSAKDDGGATKHEAWPTYIFGPGAILLSNGQLIAAKGLAYPIKVVAGESVATDGFMRVEWIESQSLLRDGTISKGLDPSFLPGTIAQLASSGECLLDKQGEVWCSSWTHFGRFEKRRSDHRNGWYRLERRDPAKIVQVEGGQGHGCALLGDGRVDCWFAEAKPSIYTFPHPIQQVAVSVDGGYQSGYHFCVLDAEGKVGCWGSGTRGQLGYVAPEAVEDGGPTYVAPKPPKKFLSFESPAIKIFAMSDETCALLANGELWCWGDTGNLHFKGEAPLEFPGNPMWDGPGKLKAAGRSTMPTAPIELPTDCTIKQLLPLPAKICVLCEAHCIKCWRDKPPAGCDPLQGEGMR